MNILHFSFGLIVAALSAPSFAIGALNAAKVIEIRIDSNGAGMVVFDQNLGGTPPTCVHAAYTNALAFNLNTPGGRGVLALALSAKATGTTMTVYGLGTCNIYNGNAEDWNYAVSK